MKTPHATCAATWSPIPACALEPLRPPSKPREILDQYPVDIVITDLKVPELGGFELLKRVRETYPQTAVIVFTQYGTIESAVEATRNGRRRLRHQAVPRFRTPHQARPRRSIPRNRPGKSDSARAASHPPRLRRLDRRFAQDAARIPPDREGQPAQLSGPDPRRERNRARSWSRARSIFRARGGTSRLFPSIAPRWSPR